MRNTLKKSGVVVFLLLMASLFILTLTSVSATDPPNPDNIPLDFVVAFTREDSSNNPQGEFLVIKDCRGHVTGVSPSCSTQSGPYSFGPLDHPNDYTETQGLGIDVFDIGEQKNVIFGVGYSLGEIYDDDHDDFRYRVGRNCFEETQPNCQSLDEMVDIGVNNWGREMEGASVAVSQINNQPTVLFSMRDFDNNHATGPLWGKRIACNEDFSECDTDHIEGIGLQGQVARGAGFDAADINGDGSTELVVVSRRQNNGNIHYRIQHSCGYNGQCGYGYEGDIPGTIPDFGSWGDFFMSSASIIDVNQDGTQDIVFIGASKAGDTVTVRYLIGYACSITQGCASFSEPYILTQYTSTNLQAGAASVLSEGGTPEENEELLCADNTDNDGDGLIDCNDESCFEFCDADDNQAWHMCEVIVQQPECGTLGTCYQNDAAPNRCCGDDYRLHITNGDFEDSNNGEWQFYQIDGNGEHPIPPNDPSLQIESNTECSHGTGSCAHWDNPSGVLREARQDVTGMLPGTYVAEGWFKSPTRQPIFLTVKTLRADWSTIATRSATTTSSSGIKLSVPVPVDAQTSYVRIIGSTSSGGNFFMDDVDVYPAQQSLDYGSVALAIDNSPSWLCMASVSSASNLFEWMWRDATLNAFKIFSVDIDIPTCIDLDEDGYGARGIDLCAHAQTDCDDSRANVNPGIPTDICDGLDEDCDGSVDEDLPGGFDMGDVCHSGVGQCIRAGHFQCSANRLSLVCDAIPGPPTPENTPARCNDGIDNDCDGSYDINDDGRGGDSDCDQFMTPTTVDDGS